VTPCRNDENVRRCGENSSARVNDIRRDRMPRTRLSSRNGGCASYEEKISP